MSYDVYTGLLNAFDLRKNGDFHPNYTYNNSNPNFQELENKYKITEISRDGTDFEKSINLLTWVSKSNYHKGDFNVDIPYNSLELLKYSYMKDYQNGINCVGLATILTECLLSIGLKARRVFIMPCSPYDGDNHVVSQVFIREMKKWVMLDPTFGAYLTNEQGEPLSLLELRSCFSKQELVLFSKEAKYNDDEWTEKSEKESLEYFAKNLFYFQTYENSEFGHTDATIMSTESKTNRFITICPDNYNVKEMRLSNIAYRIKRYGYFRQANEWIENVKKEKYNYCSYEYFETNPYSSL